MMQRKRLPHTVRQLNFQRGDRLLLYVQRPTFLHASNWQCHCLLEIESSQKKLHPLALKHAWKPGTSIFVDPCHAKLANTMAFRGQAHFEAGFFMIRFTFELACSTVDPLDAPAAFPSSLCTSRRQCSASPDRLGMLL